MFQALMGRFQLELFIFIIYFHRRENSCVFFPVQLNCQLPKPEDRRNSNTLKKTCSKCRVNEEWPTVELSTAQARKQKKLQRPTRPVENVVLTMKGLQERKHNC